ncbi:MAG: lipopolysaccharide biosynthesis protein, partial [Bradyrhizobium sp.]
MAVVDTQPATASPAGVTARLRSMLGSLVGGSSEASVTRRLAGTIFIIRVVSAMLAYFSQILLARWMGGSDYGVYVYVWTWVLLLGSMMDFGISASAQKIIPEYRTSGEHALLRGFLSGSRWMTFGVSSVVSLLLMGLVRLLSPWIDANAIVPLYIGCLTLPPFVVANTQDGIARSHDWMRLGLMPQFIVRQGLIIGFTAGAFALGFHFGATAAMLVSAAAVWVAMIGQMLVLNRRLDGHIEPGAVLPLAIGCLTLPAFVVANTQDGIARSHDWMRLGLMPQFIVRQSLIIGFTAGAFALGFHLGATIAMLASTAAVW